MTEPIIVPGEDEFPQDIVLEWKSWNTMKDPLVCANCRANASQGWIPYHRPFQSGDQAPPAHRHPFTGAPTCRCFLRYVIQKTKPVDDPPTLF